MAVSNTIGSNVFDILIGLAVPWFIQTAVISAGSTVSAHMRCHSVTLQTLAGPQTVASGVFGFNRFLISYV